MKNSLSGEFSPREIFPKSKGAIDLPNREAEVGSSLPFLTEELLESCLEERERIGNKYEDWEDNARSIIFQQNMIRCILSVREKTEEVEKIWNEYETKAEIFLEKIKDPEKKKRVKTSFGD
jgi:hypothetical protein